MNGPTMRDCADGNARRTPRSTVRGTITRAMASHASASPAAGSLPRKKLMFAPSVLAPAGFHRIASKSNRLERLSFHRVDQAIKLDIGLVPAGQLLHVGEPARHVRVFREVDPDDFAERHQAGAEVVRDRHLVAA